MSLTLALTGCLGEQWLTNNNDDYSYNGQYGNNLPPPPPGDNRNGNYNGNNPPPPPPGDNRGNNGYYDNRGNNGYYDNRGNNGYYDNRGNNGRGGNYYYNNRPAMGTEVSQLPSSARRIISGGQELYVYNGVMYQPVRSRAGVTYRVVGYSDY